MTSNLDDISVAIGEMWSEVAGLRRDFQASETRANDHRNGVHKRMDDLAVEVGDIKADVAAAAGTIEGVKSDMDGMKPVTDEVRRWKQMGIGALAVVGMGGAALGYALTSPIDWLLKLFSRG